MESTKSKVIFIIPSEEYLGGVYHYTIKPAIELNKYGDTK